jgi:hypothetical protein
MRARGRSVDEPAIVSMRFSTSVAAFIVHASRCGCVAFTDTTATADPWRPVTHTLPRSPTRSKSCTLCPRTQGPSDGRVREGRLWAKGPRADTSHKYSPKRRMNSAANSTVASSSGRARRLSIFRYSDARVVSCHKRARVVSLPQKRNKAENTRQKATSSGSGMQIL